MSNRPQPATLEEARVLVYTFEDAMPVHAGLPLFQSRPAEIKWFAMFVKQLPNGKRQPIEIPVPASGKKEAREKAEQIVKELELKGFKYVGVS